MTTISVISGSTLGGAEYVAEFLAEQLQEAGFTSQVHHGPAFSELDPNHLWLLVCSTHGAGDLPENLQPFYNHIIQQAPDLSRLKYAAIGIGSREYDTFCGAIEKLDHLLQQRGAQRVGETLRIDILQHDLPEDAAMTWLGQWITLL